MSLNPSALVPINKPHVYYSKDGLVWVLGGLCHPETWVSPWDQFHCNRHHHCHWLNHQLQNRPLEQVLAEIQGHTHFQITARWCRLPGLQLALVGPFWFVDENSEKVINIAFFVYLPSPHAQCRIIHVRGVLPSLLIVSVVKCIHERGFAWVKVW